ncbi:MAG: CDP-diacylglycerol--glycerol-3-phosphate 3-phosphatidyltransferase [Clostridia bacterium]|nr:CDP-diacylglycerol--glycerol-3-phosphate 3-phosphatidyltransferase [Clostridia bacterium]
MNTPNKITLARLLLIPLVVFFYLAEFVPYGKLISTIIFVVACLTDFLDGYIARKHNQVTTLGKFFDSIADKVLIMTGLLLIVLPTSSILPAVYPTWLGLVCVIIILAREFIVSALRQVAAAKGVVLAADKGGKIKAVAQYVVVTAYMILGFIQAEFLPISLLESEGLSVVRFILMILLVAATVLTIYSGCSYLIRNRKVFKENAKTESKEIKSNEVEKTAKNKGKTSKLDVLFYDAVNFFFARNAVSTTALQREYGIGYPRASRMVKTMVDLGIVRDSEEPNKRELNMTKEEFEKKFGKNAD